MGKEIQVNSLEEMCDLMCDNKLPDGQKMTIEQVKVQLNDLLEYCAESGEEWENDKEALQIAIRFIEAWQSVREQLIDELTGLDMFLEKEATIKWVLELIDRTLEEDTKDDSEL